LDLFMKEMKQKDTIVKKRFLLPWSESICIANLLFVLKI